MMRDEYRWTDHVITHRRLRAEFVATLLILAIVGGAGLVDRAPGQDHRSAVAQGPASARHAPSLAAITRTPLPPLHKEARHGVASSGHC
jgi:hypothetical protein